MKLRIDNRITYDVWVGTTPGEWKPEIDDCILEQIHAQILGLV